VSDSSVLSDTMNTHMTPAEAAEVMGVSDRTVRRWLEACTEGVDYVRTPGNRIRITRSCVATWVEQTVVAA
jgi:excisionase family DNA binding protein